MRLTELEATFIGDFAIGDNRSQWREIDTVDGAQAISFSCPKCRNETILVPFANPRNAEVIPVSAFPRITHRWQFTGDTIDTVTITPSIDLSKVDDKNPDYPGRCKWHGWVKNGDAS